MTSKPKIYVAGHRGMVGSAIVRNYKSRLRNKLVAEAFYLTGIASM
jgi:nucleoside-diphosphate-sugar epimerase